MRNVGSTAAIDVLMMVCQLLMGIIVGRALGPEGRGEVATIVLWPAFVSGSIVGGFRISLVYHLSRDADNRGDVIAAGVVANFLGATIASVFIVLFTPLLLSDASVQCLDLLTLVAVLLPLCSIGSVLEPILLAKKDYRKWNLLRASEPVFMLSSALLAAFGDMLTVSYVIFSYVAARLAFTFGLIVYLIKQPAIEAITSVSKTTIKYAFQCQPSAWLGSVNAQSDQLILSSLFSPAALGLYRTGSNVAGFLRFAFVGFQRILLPETAAAGNSAERLRRVRNFLIASTAFAVLAAIPFFFVIGPAIILLYGQEFEGASIPARIMIIAVVIRGMIGILGNGFRGIGRPLVPFWANVLGSFVLAIGLFRFIPLWGTAGAAGAIVLSSLSVAVILVWVFFKDYETVKQVKNIRYQSEQADSPVSA